MLQINRVKCIIVTANDGKFGFDHIFSNGLNLIASTENTKGKSSIIESIYYCLGVEELLGGTNEKSLTPVYKTAIDYGEKKNIVPIKTSFYLEVFNDRRDIITMNRDVEHTSTSNNLIKVFWGSINEVLEGKCDFQEMFVNIPGGATSDRGFHRFLEEYIGWQLPNVPTFEDSDRKLYLQTLFAAMFIEQKRGWSNLLATIPSYYGIKDIKTKVIEYLLNLDTIKNEKLKIECKIQERLIKEKWTNIVENINSDLNSNNCSIRALYEKPKVIDEENIKQMIIFKKYDEEEIELESYIRKKQLRAENLSQQSLKVGNNIQELEERLKILQEEIQNEFEKKKYKNKEKILERASINKLRESLEIINKDLTNHKDINKLKKLGGFQDGNLLNNICPTCNQEINDCLMEQPLISKVMDIDEQIKHLSAQKQMIEYSLNSHKSNLENIEKDIEILETEIISKTKEIRRITNDIYSTDESLSTAIVYEKVHIENEVEDLLKMKQNIDEHKEELLNLSKEWIDFIEKKNKLPKGVFSESDLEKLNKLKDLFINKLRTYNYASNQNIHSIEISKDRLVPTLNGFDLMKDGSASDLIRIIWDFTLSILTVANENNGNHSKVVIFDEPAQQSIENKDLYSFINDINENYKDSQIILGITLNNPELEKYVKDMMDINLILIEDKAIKPIQ